MIPVYEYSRFRDYFLQEHHEDSLMFQLSLGYTRRKLGECGIKLNVCSSTYFLGETTSCVLACPKEGFIDIWISAKQVIQLANELGILVSETAIASALHETGHIEQWRQAAEGLSRKPESDWECEFEAYALGELYAVALNGREVNSSYRLIRDYLLGDRPQSQAKTTKPVAAASAPATLQPDDITQELERLKAILLDIRTEGIKRSAEATAAPKPNPKKLLLSASLAPRHIYNARRPEIRLASGIGCFG